METKITVFTALPDPPYLDGFIRRERSFLDRRIKEAAEAKPGVFARSTYGDVTSFFDEASADYDSDRRNPYWAFAHDILKHILRTHIANHFPAGQKIRFFDAGAGTGNWSEFLLEIGCTVGRLFDMNGKMLNIASGKVKQAGGSGIKIDEGDLEDRAAFPSAPSNLILCMHNVIGMGRDTARIVHNLCDYLEPGGLAFIMATNKYHAFNFASRYRSRDEVLRVVADSTVKFKDDMPEMFCYTPEEFQRLLLEAGFSKVTVLGFPVSIYPELPDTKLLRRDTLSHQLRHPPSRRRLLEREKILSMNPALAYRGGSSLIAVCQKSPVG